MKSHPHGSGDLWYTCQHGKGKVHTLRRGGLRRNLQVELCGLIPLHSFLPMKGAPMKTLDEIKQKMAAGDTAHADEALKETLFCIRQLEQKRILKEMLG